MLWAILVLLKMLRDFHLEEIKYYIEVKALKNVCCVS